jgi:hypothetical protein
MGELTETRLKLGGIKGPPVSSQLGEPAARRPALPGACVRRRDPACLQPPGQIVERCAVELGPDALDRDLGGDHAQIMADRPRLWPAALPR